MSVPNQNKVLIIKEPTDKAHPYSCISLDAFNYAAIHCDTIGAFKLWCYLAKNQNKYEFELSRAAFCAWSGLSSRTYTDALKALKDQSFLVQDENQKNKYLFYELPHNSTMPTSEEDCIIKIPEEKRRVLKEFYF